MHIRIVHGLAMGAGRTKVKPTAYRDGQNVIRDSSSRVLVDMPPEAKVAPPLMKAMAPWIKSSEADLLPCPIPAEFARINLGRFIPTIMAMAGPHGY